MKPTAIFSRTILLLLLALFIQELSSHAAAPVVSNVRASQRLGTGLVDILGAQVQAVDAQPELRKPAFDSQAKTQQSAVINSVIENEHAVGTFPGCQFGIVQNLVPIFCMDDHGYQQVYIA